MKTEIWNDVWKTKTEQQANNDSTFVSGLALKIIQWHWHTRMLAHSDIWWCVVTNRHCLKLVIFFLCSRFCLPFNPSPHLFLPICHARSLMPVLPDRGKCFFLLSCVNLAHIVRFVCVWQKKVTGDQKFFCFRKRVVCTKILWDVFAVVQCRKCLYRLQHQCSDF